MQIMRSKPVSEQVSLVLRDRIGNADYLPGQRLPSESLLSEEFGVSRATIRTVLAKLATEGLILRKQGDGTYVNERITEINTHSGGLWDFSHLIKRSGYRVTIKAIASDKILASKEVALVLALNEGDELFSLKRLFLANQTPVIFVENLIPVSLNVNAVAEIDGSLPISDIIDKYFQQEIAFSTVAISSAKAGEMAEILSIKPDDPLLRLNMRFYSSDNQPLSIGYSYFNDNILKPKLVQVWN